MTIDIDGLNINYLDEYNGNDRDNADVMLLLQGWGTSVSLYSGVIAKAAEGYRVLAPDLPGFGDSSEPETPWSVSDYADFVLKFCERLGIKKAVLFAHSFGGRIVIKLFSRGGAGIEVPKIILTGAAGIKPVQSEQAKKRAAAYQRGKAFLSSKPMKALFPNALENLRKKHGSADYNAASPMMRQVLVKTVNEDLSAYLSSVTPETLLIWGRNDDAVPLSDAQRMEKEMPDAGLVVIENAGHFAFIEQQYMFLRVMASFLGLNLD